MSTEPVGPMVPVYSRTATTLLASNGSMSKPPPGKPAVKSAPSTCRRRTDAPAGP